ncbi:uncharacterized protein BCR38DRAFT_521627 [Pseudomassariella vexata]|uniref:Uncharacterized protein n=1 Tax=Pseudomassariella vexata TaxID=1141098 RepID=A0A1Y2EAK4_9PEZI|nr:uncharacterized protein BCR38DRAFT_521627 [Pseudomassariella vexata]ORY68603.1 hypothetical protein BCR38DRAFT_521627 [Pseudomassariella vexata]
MDNLGTRVRISLGVSLGDGAPSSNPYRLSLLTAPVGPIPGFEAEFTKYAPSSMINNSIADEVDMAGGRRYTDEKIHFVLDLVLRQRLTYAVAAEKFRKKYNDKKFGEKQVKYIKSSYSTHPEFGVYLYNDPRSQKTASSSPRTTTATSAAGTSTHLHPSIRPEAMSRYAVSQSPADSMGLGGGSQFLGGSPMEETPKTGAGPRGTTCQMPTALDALGKLKSETGRALSSSTASQSSADFTPCHNQSGATYQGAHSLKESRPLNPHYNFSRAAWRASTPGHSIETHEKPGAVGGDSSPTMQQDAIGAAETAERPSETPIPSAIEAKRKRNIGTLSEIEGIIAARAGSAVDLINKRPRTGSFTPFLGLARDLTKSPSSDTTKKIVDAIMGETRMGGQGMSAGSVDSQKTSREALFYSTPNLDFFSVPLSPAAEEIIRKPNDETKTFVTSLNLISEEPKISELAGVHQQHGISESTVTDAPPMDALFAGNVAQGMPGNAGTSTTTPGTNNMTSQETSASDLISNFTASIQNPGGFVMRSPQGTCYRAPSPPAPYTRDNYVGWDQIGHIYSTKHENCPVKTHHRHDHSGGIYFVNMSYLMEALQNFSLDIHIEARLKSGHDQSTTANANASAARVEATVKSDNVPLQIHAEPAATTADNRNQVSWEEAALNQSIWTAGAETHAQLEGLEDRRRTAAEQLFDDNSLTEEQYNDTTN